MKKKNNMRLRILIKEVKCNKHKMLRRYSSIKNMDESKPSASYLIQTDDENLDSKKFGKIKKFMNFSLHKLGIKSPIKVTVTKDRNLYGLKTMAHFNNEDSHCVVYSNNRNVADILRSIAHELVHKSQFENDKIKGKVQDIGGPIEDEANAVAGQLVKEFGYKNPEIFE